MSQHPTEQPVRRWRVTVNEWLSHVAVIEATVAKEAEAKVREFWAENAEHEIFSFKDAGVDGVLIETDSCLAGALFPA
jgi:hypothetical protein